MKIMLGILASAALAALVGTGLYLRFGLQVLDRPGMENPAGPMLELLNADWMSDDGVWSARIEGETLDLSYRQELVYSGGFSFDFQGDGLNAKTELSFDDKQFESEDGSVSSTMESLSVENRKLYLVITVSKAGEASVRQQIVLKVKDRAASVLQKSVLQRAGCLKPSLICLIQIGKHAGHAADQAEPVQKRQQLRRRLALGLRGGQERGDGALIFKRHRAGMAFLQRGGQIRAGQGRRA